MEAAGPRLLAALPPLRVGGRLGWQPAAIKDQLRGRCSGCRELGTPWLHRAPCAALHVPAVCTSPAPISRIDPRNECAASTHHWRGPRGLQHRHHLQTESYPGGIEAARLPGALARRQLARSAHCAAAAATRGREAGRQASGRCRRSMVKLQDARLGTRRATAGCLLCPGGMASPDRQYPRIPQTSPVQPGPGIYAQPAPPEVAGMALGKVGLEQRVQPADAHRAHRYREMLC